MVCCTEMNVGSSVATPHCAGIDSFFSQGGGFDKASITFGQRTHELAEKGCRNKQEQGLQCPRLTLWRPFFSQCEIMSCGLAGV